MNRNVKRYKVLDMKLVRDYDLEVGKTYQYVPDPRPRDADVPFLIEAETSTISDYRLGEASSSRFTVGNKWRVRIGGMSHVVVQLNTDSFIWIVRFRSHMGLRPFYFVEI